jgi:AcrR family transcriptional regulator
MPIRPNHHQRAARHSIVDEMRRTSRAQRQMRDQMRDQLRDRLDELRGRMQHPDEPAEVVWTRLERASPRAQREVDRIVSAAIEVADREGLDALSMRRLASSLGTGTTSLYRYVRNKEELLTLMVDAVNAGDPLPAGPPADWRAAFTTVARAHRRQLLAHPWLVGEIASRPAIGPNTLRSADRILGIALGMGLDAMAAGSVVSTLLRYVRGAVADELAELDAERRTGMTQDQWRGSIAPYVVDVVDSGRFPSFASVIASPDPTDEEQFEFGLARLLDGFERLIDASRSSQGSG